MNSFNLQPEAEIDPKKQPPLTMTSKLLKTLERQQKRSVGGFMKFEFMAGVLC